MTRYEPVTFTDVKVGDTIKSVSPCGTEHRGAVATKDDVRATDANGYWLASKILGDGWTLYRRAPKPAKFVLQDVPEVGQWIEATYGDGHVETFKVAGADTWRVKADVYGSMGAPMGCGVCDYIPLSESVNASASERHHITSWRPTTPPAPKEPSGFGAVVEVASKRYLRDDVHAKRGMAWWRGGEASVSWGHICDQGPVTVLSEGVTK